MPPQPLTRELMQEAVNLLHANGGSVTKAAAAAGLKRTTLSSRLSEAQASGIISPTIAVGPSRDPKDDIIANLRAELESARSKNVARPHFTIRQDRTAHSTPIRVIAVGDMHDSPLIESKERFEWVGAFAREQKPDLVLQIGDFATLDSLNAHIPNETLDGKLKPSFERDMGSFNLALQAMQLDGIEKHCTLGNHERRLYAYEQSHPEMEGKLAASLDDVLKNNCWTYSPYGQITYYGGVGFVHAALNILSKTYGGKNCLPTIANDSISDLVIGHSHRARVHSAPKIGQRYPTTILDLGCALPDGHIESYAQHALNGWTYGIYDLTIQFGHIQSAKFISMAELEERYGRAA
jgi:transposase-like protein